MPEQNGWGCDRCRQFYPPGAPQVQQQQPQSYAQQPQQAYAPQPQQPQQPYPQQQQPYGQQQPPQQQAYSPYQQHPGPHGQPMGAMPPPAGAPKSGGGSKAMIFVIGGVVVAGGIVAAFFLTRGGGAGAGSKDGVVKDALAAMTAGDVDALVNLGDPVALFDKAIDCKKKDDADDDDKDRKRRHRDDDDDDERDPRRQADKLRKKMKKLAAATKDVKFELVEIIEPEKKESDKGGSEYGKGERFKKGDKLMPGCVAKTDIAFVGVKAKVKVTEGDREPVEQKVSFGILDVDGRFYLVEPPRIELKGALEKELVAFKTDMCACTDAKCTEGVQKDIKSWKRDSSYKADKLDKSDKDRLKKVYKDIGDCSKKAGGKGDTQGEAMAKMVEFKDKMCACKEHDTKCAQAVTDDMTKWAQDMAKNSDPSSYSDMSSDDAKQMADVSKAMGECSMKAMTPDTSGGGGSDIGLGSDTSAPPPPPPPDVPAAGGDLEAAPAGMEACNEYKAVLQKMISCDKYPASAKDSLKKAWAQMVDSAKKGGPSVIKAMADTCTRATPDLKKATATICP